MRTLTIGSESAKCRITINGDGRTDQESWYKLWRQAAAIEQLCVVAKGEPGIAYDMGVFSLLDA